VDNVTPIVRFGNTELGNLEIKKVDGNGNPLSGSSFLITPNPKTGIDNLTVVDNGANDNSSTAGTLLVTGCKLNVEYTVHESVTPSGYKTAPNQTITLTSSDVVTLTFTNNLGKIIINKKDAAGNIIHIAGAVFKITPNPYTGTDNLSVTDNVVVNGNYDNSSTLGIVELINVPLNVQYTITETAAPTGYALDTASQQGTITTETPNLTITFNYTNQLGKIIINKKDASGAIIHIAGAVFKITPNPYTGTDNLSVTDNVVVNGNYDNNTTLGIVELINVPLERAIYSGRDGSADGLCALIRPPSKGR